MLPIPERYQWEAEHIGGETVRQYNGSGEENPSSLIRPPEVVRFSIVPRVPGLPRHDILLDRNKGELFVRRFGRGFMKNTPTGVKHFEYLQCVVTNRYRVYVCSTSGQVMVTNADFEVYL